jgi:hypothetical protein
VSNPYDNWLSLRNALTHTRRQRLAFWWVDTFFKNKLPAELWNRKRIAYEAWLAGYRAARVDARNEGLGK